MARKTQMTVEQAQDLIAQDSCATAQVGPDTVGHQRSYQELFGDLVTSQEPEEEQAFMDLIQPMPQDSAPLTSVFQEMESWTMPYAGQDIPLTLEGDGFFYFPAGVGNRDVSEIRLGMGIVKRIVLKKYSDGTTNAMIVVQSKNLSKAPIPFLWKNGELSVMSREEVERIKFRLESPILVQRRVDAARAAKEVAA